MDYANEEWIKVYVRSTAAWRTTSLAARGLALELSRAMGRFSDEIRLGPRGLRAVAALVSASWEEVEPLLEELLRDGRLLYDEERQLLRDPVHAARQRATSSAAQRKRDQRAAASATAPRRKRSSDKPNSRHAESRDVTRESRREEREEKEENRERDARAHEVADAPEEPETATATSSRQTWRDELPTDGPPPLDATLPPDLRARASEIIARTGVVDVDVEASWRNYVCWLAGRQAEDPALLPEQCAVVEGRWMRWVQDDCSRAAQTRKRQHEREWSGPRLVSGGGGGGDGALAPYHRPTQLAMPDQEPPAPPAAPRRGLPRQVHDDSAREAAARLAAGRFG